MGSVSRISLRHRLKAALGRSPLPEGTIPIGVALGVAGVSAYAFLIIAARALGKHDYAPLAVLWALSSLVGPGFFLPLEQEVARAMAARRIRGEGGAPVFVKAALFGVGLLAGLLVAGLAAGPYLTDNLFDGQWLVLAALLASLAATGVAHLFRGALAGQGRFGAYARYVAGETGWPFLFVVVLAVVGSTSVGLYSLALTVGPLVAIAVALRGQWSGLLEPGPPATWREISTSLAWLLMGSAFSMGLVNAGPVALRLLADGAQKDEVGPFLAGLVVARVPLFLFQAIQAALLPRLAALASERRLQELRRSMAQLLLVLGGIVVVASLAMAPLGPTIVHLLFGGDFLLGSRTMALLTFGSGLFMVASAVGQANIALGRQRAMALGWAAGLAALLVTLAVASDDLFLRVELAGVLGGGVALVVELAVMRVASREAEALDPDNVIEALTDLPFNV